MKMNSFKFGLVGLLVGLIGLTSFGSCDSFSSSSFSVLVHQQRLVSGNTCVKVGNASASYYSYVNYLNSSGVVLYTPTSASDLFCFDEDGIVALSDDFQNTRIYFDSYDISPLYSGYILESSIDTNYCVENQYCPLESTGVEWSALYINDIQHQSSPQINITIPEEFNWDYTGSEESFDLSIQGYNVDTQYIDGIIVNQTTLPNNQDFNNIISGVLPLLIPGFVIILFIYFVFRFIKKIL